MSGLKVKLNRAGVRELLRSSEVQADLIERARRIAASAGEGMTAQVEVGPERARASVFTDTPEAMVAEAEGRRLSTALDAGR